jgi:mono/diheme cytochrome c family protein
MSRLLLNLALALLLLLLGGAHVALRDDPGQPGLELFPEMAHSPRANAFSSSAVFADGMTLRSPPPGTVARGHAPLGFAAGPEEAERAGRELLPPGDLVDPGRESRGAEVYTTFCQPCHGAGGAGDGPVTRRGVPPPPSLLAEHALAMPDGRVYHVVTSGQGNMPGYAPQISREDRWNAVSYLRWLQRREPTGDAAQSSPAAP